MAISTAHMLLEWTKDLNGEVRAWAAPSMKRRGCPGVWTAWAGVGVAEFSAATCVLEAPDACPKANSMNEATTSAQHTNEHANSPREITRSHRPWPGLA